MRLPARLNPSRSITLRIVALVWASLAATSGVAIVLSARELRGELMEKGRLEASAIADLLEYAFEPLLERGDILSMQRCAENVATIAGVEKVCVVGRDGQILASGDPSEVGQRGVSDFAPLAAVLDGQEPERVWQEGSLAQATLNLVKPLRGGGFDPRDHTDVFAAAWVKISLRPLYRQIAGSLLFLCLATLLCAGLFSVCLGWILSRTVARPLVELSRATTEVARGRLDTVVPICSRDEIGQLARNFRTMTESLSEARRDMDSLLHLVSHDLRGPLINIEGFTQRLQKTLPSRAAPDLHQWVEREAPQCLDFILRSVDKMRRLVEGLLRLTRQPAGPLQLRPVDLQAVVRRVLEDQKQSIASRSVHVEVGSLPVVAGDETLLEEVFQHLIRNALQYMGDQPLPRVVVSSSKQGELWRLAVADNGIGISPENRALLFMPFQRFSPALAQGEGIGLCLARRILRRLGGTIWADSEPGKGCTFYSTLPAETSLRAAEPAAGAHSSRATPGLPEPALRSAGPGAGHRPPAEGAPALPAAPREGGQRAKEAVSSEVSR